MKICMIGSGYVGLVSGSCCSELGNHVICVDNNLNKIISLKNGIIPIYEPGLEELIYRNVKQKRLKFSTNLSKSIQNSDIIFICVGTPTNKRTNEANLKFINNSLFIDLGQKHGLRNRQIGIIKKNYQTSLKSNLDTTVLFISEINANRSKLVPLNDKVKISELDKMKIQFIE